MGSSQRVCAIPMDRGDESAEVRSAKIRQGKSLSALGASAQSIARAVGSSANRRTMALGARELEGDSTLESETILLLAFLRP